MSRKPLSFLDLLQKYLTEYLPIVKGLSDATIESYKATFRLLLEFMNTVKGIIPDKMTFSLLNHNTIIDFLNWLEKDRGCSISTRNQRLSALSAFSLYAQNYDTIDASMFRNSISKVPRKKAPRQGRSVFTREELKILFELPSSSTDIGRRDRVLLCTLYASGMRAQELCDMTVGDIQFYPDRAGITVHGKGNKVRRIGIPKESSSILKDYIHHRGLSEQPKRHVFSSQMHEHMTVSCVEEIFSKYVNIAKEKYPEMFRSHYTPHSMRHTTATHMIHAGVPLIVVKNFLGHSSIQTTEIYVEITQDSINQHLIEWNKRWFLSEEPSKSAKQENSIPDFLR